MNRWYVIGTHSRSEEKAVHHLQRQGYQTYLPRYLKRRSHARKVDWVPSPMFPGYLFVSLDTEVDQWRSIRSTVGVTQLISHGETPTPVPVGIIEDIQVHENDQGIVSFTPVAKFKKGDRVQIIDGSFLDHTGIFECADDRERVFILLDLLGREVKVRLPAEAVTVQT